MDVFGWIAAKVEWGALRITSHLPAFSGRAAERSPFPESKKKTKKKTAEPHNAAPSGCANTMAASAARQPPSFGAAANEPPDDDAGSDADGAVLASFPSPSYRGRPRYPLPTAAVGPTPPPGHHPAQSVPGTPQRGLSNGRTGGAPGEDEESLGGSRAAADADADAAARRRHVSRAGIQTSVDAFKHLVATAEEYTAQMLRLAAESAKFAQALETVARSDIGGNGD
ncbi:MAG: hypothetical protein BJ554DRAFT_6725, partial [Olpidium bornovanus]